MKTIKQDESIARSRFIDCPVCKNHTLKLKRTVQVGRCKSCSESYKIVIVYVKDGKKAKPQTATPISQTESKPEPAPESALPAWQSPSESATVGSSSEPYAGLSEALFGPKPDEKQTEVGSGSGK
jgi:ribosomal protein S27E